MNHSGGLLAAGLAMASMVAVRMALDSGRRSVIAHRLADRTPAAGGAGFGRRLPAPPAALVRRLHGAGLSIGARELWAGWVAMVVAAVAAGWLVGGPGLAAVAVTISVAVPAVALRTVSGRSDRLVEDSLPEVLEGVARSLRSGATLRQAVDETAEVTTGLLGTDLATVASEVARGRVLTDALDRWGERRPLPGVRLAVSALALGAETGGAHARAIDGVAATLRSRVGVVREVRALSSQARLSGVVITLAPLGFSALAAASDERTAGFLLRTPLGLFCLATGLALDAAAALWMMRLSRIDV